MNRLLVIALLDFAAPNCGASYFASFTDQGVALPEPEFVAFVAVEIHLQDVT
jgi:hypothetical protein